MKARNIWCEIRKKLAGIIYPKIRNPHPKEEYYNNKFPKTDIIYNGRHIPNSNKRIGIDVRDFFMPYDSEIRKLIERLTLGETDDEKAFNCLRYVIQNIRYVGDTKKGYREFWQFPFETLFYKTGDCEDGAILLANLMLQAGIPYWKIRLTAGWVKRGKSKVGHVYLNYYCEEKDKWVVLDWCYWPNLLKIAQRKPYKEEKRYLDVWFSWNQKYAFTKGLNTEARRILR